MANEYIISGSLILDVADASRKLSKVKDDTKGVETQTRLSGEKIERDWGKIGKKIEDVGSNLTKKLTLPILGLAAAAVKFATDQEESLNKVDVVFQDSADEVKKWSDTTIDRFGIAKGTALEMSSLFGDMGVSMGLTREESSKMAMNLSGLAGDLASFKNISVDRAQVALAGIYTGETEALKGLGIVMNETNLAAFAQAEGATKSWKEMDQAEKVAWRYKFVMDATADAQGDFARTSDGVANQSRVTQERMKELAAEFGENLLPIIADVLGYVNDLLKAFTNTDESTQNAILWGLAVAAAVGPVTKAVGGVITNLNSVTKLFSTGGMSMASLGWVGAALLAVGAIAAVVIAVKSDYDALVKDATELNKSMDTLKKALVDSERDYQEETDLIFATAEAAKSYLDRLAELEAQGLKTAEAQMEYKAILEALKKTMPELNIEIDNQTGKIEGGTKAIYDRIDALTAQAVAEAMNKKQEVQIEALAAATIDLFDKERKLKTLRTENQEVLSKYNSLTRDLAAATGLTERAIRNLTTTDLCQLYADATPEVRELIKAYADLTLENNDLIITHNSLSTAVEDAQVVMGEAKTTVIETTQAATDLQLQLGETSAAMEETVPAAGAAVEATEELTEAQREAIKIQEELERAVKKGTDEIVNGYEKVETKGKISLNQALKNLQYNNAQAKLAADNYTALIDKGYNKDFVQSLYDGGADGRSILAEIVKDTKGKGKELEAEWFAAGVNSKEAIGDGMSGVAAEVTAAASGAVAAATTIGSDTGQGYANGLDSKINTIKAAARRLANAATGTLKNTLEISSPSKKMAREVGVPMAQGVVSGMEQGLKKSMGKIKTSTDGIVTGIASGQSSAATQTKASSQQNMRDLFAARSSASVIQNNTFTSKELSPYEQRVHLQRLDNDLAEVFG